MALSSNKEGYVKAFGTAELAERLERLERMTSPMNVAARMAQSVARRDQLAPRMAA
jgi:hypothetical protein